MKKTLSFSKILSVLLALLCFCFIVSCKSSPDEPTDTRATYIIEYYKTKNGMVGGDSPLTTTTYKEGNSEKVQFLQPYKAGLTDDDIPNDKYFSAWVDEADNRYQPQTDLPNKLDNGKLKVYADIKEGDGKFELKFLADSSITNNSEILLDGSDKKSSPYSFHYIKTDEQDKKGLWQDYNYKNDVKDYYKKLVGYCYYSTDGDKSDIVYKQASESEDVTINFGSDITIVPIYEKTNQYKLTLDVNGASNVTNVDLYYFAPERAWYKKWFSSVADYLNKDFYINKISPDDEDSKKIFTETPIKGDVKVIFNNNSHGTKPNDGYITGNVFNGFENAYVNKDGVLDTSLSISENTVAKAIFNEKGSVQSITLPYLTDSSYLFSGWYEDSALTKLVDNASALYIPKKNTTLYAKWTKKSGSDISVSTDKIAFQQIMSVNMLIHDYFAYIDSSEKTIKQTYSNEGSIVYFSDIVVDGDITLTGSIVNGTTQAIDLSKVTFGSDREIDLGYVMYKMPKGSYAPYLLYQDQTDEDATISKIYAKLKGKLYRFNDSIAEEGGKGTIDITLVDDNTINLNNNPQKTLKNINKNGGTIQSPGSATIGWNISTNIKEGYEFIGWGVYLCSPSEIEIDGRSYTMITKKSDLSATVYIPDEYEKQPVTAVTLKARYEAKRYTITFKSSNNENAEIMKAYYNHDGSNLYVVRGGMEESITTYPDCVESWIPSEKHFDGWKKEGSDGIFKRAGEAFDASQVGNADITLIATYADGGYYTLNLVANSTYWHDGNKTLYFSNNKWYSDSSLQNVIDSITSLDYKPHNADEYKVAGAITFVTNGGTKPSVDTISGSSFVMYDYNGVPDWVDKDGNFIGITKALTENRVEYVSWEGYRPLGGGTPKSSKDGYAFRGWSLTNGSKDAIDFQAYKPTSKDLTLYAIFDKVVYTLTINKGQSINASDVKIYYLSEDGEEKTRGWYRDESCTTPLNMNDTIYQNIPVLKGLTIRYNSAYGQKPSDEQIPGRALSGTEKGFVNKDGLFIGQTKTISEDTTDELVFNKLSDSGEIILKELSDANNLFLGWKDANGKYIDNMSSPFLPEKDTTLTAVWVQKRQSEQINSQLRKKVMGIVTFIFNTTTDDPEGQFEIVQRLENGRQTFYSTTFENEQLTATNLYYFNYDEYYTVLNADKFVIKKDVSAALPDGSIVSLKKNETFNNVYINVKNDGDGNMEGYYSVGGKGYKWDNESSQAYSITLKDNNNKNPVGNNDISLGEKNTPFTLSYPESWTKSTTLSDSNEDFIGFSWSEDSNYASFGINEDGIATINYVDDEENMNLYAVYGPKRSFVKFVNPNDTSKTITYYYLYGSSKLEPFAKADSEIKSYPDCPVSWLSNGKKFKGWKLNDGTDIYEVNSNIDLDLFSDNTIVYLFTPVFEDASYYTLTLMSGVNSVGEINLFYANNKWYKDSAFSTEVTESDNFEPRTKGYNESSGERLVYKSAGRIIYNADGGIAGKTREKYEDTYDPGTYVYFYFKGYKGFVDEDGKFDLSASISQNTKSNALWNGYRPMDSTATLYSCYKEGYTFRGWSLTNGGELLDLTQGYTPNKLPLNLYALYDKIDDTASKTAATSEKVTEITTVKNAVMNAIASSGIKTHNIEGGKVVYTNAISDAGVVMNEGAVYALSSVETEPRDYDSDGETVDALYIKSNGALQINAQSYNSFMLYIIKKGVKYGSSTVDVNASFAKFIDNNGNTTVYSLTEEQLENLFS